MQQELKSELTKQLIIDQAFQLFYENGFKTTSVEKVMQATSLTKGAFYHLIFSDGTKVISRPSEDERFDKETGLAMCIAKRVYGGRGQFLQAVEGATVQAVKSEDSYSMNWVEALNEIVNSLSRFVAENKKETDEQ